jgi:AraC-like DNA-binding protein
LLIRSVALQNYEKAARDIGIDPLRQMREAGLVCARPVPGETFVPELHFKCLLEDTAAAGACPDFGLRMALSPNDNHEGPLLLLLRHSPTLGDALALLQRYSHAYSHGLRMAIAPAPDARGRVDVIIAGRDAAAARFVQATEFSLATLVGLVRHLLGHPHRPLSDDAAPEATIAADDAWEVLLTHPAHGAHAAWRTRLGVIARHDMPYTALRLPAPELARPLPARNDLRLRMAISYIEAHYRKAESWADQVRRLLRERLDAGAPMLGDIAAELTLHEKTLQRRLAKEGHAFPALLDEVRREGFLELLRLPARPGLAQIAQMLGYSEQAALSRSCQRWFGCSPSEMLRRQQGAGASAPVARNRVAMPLPAT